MCHSASSVWLHSCSMRSVPAAFDVMVLRIHCMLQLIFLSVKCISACVQLYGGGGGGRVTVCWPWNPTTSVLQSITTYCRAALCSQVSVSLLSVKIPILNVSSARCLSPPLPSPSLLHLCRVYVSLCPFLCSLRLCVCSRGHSASSADTVHCFSPGGSCWDWDRYDFLSVRNTGGTETHYSMYYTAWQ